MDANKIKEVRRQLSAEFEKLAKSIKRSRLAAEEIRLENTEDEYDLASISHDRDLLYNIHEGDFARLQFIQQALRSIDRGQYGECTQCGEDIDEKRLDAVPWATMCIRCQEEKEMEQTSSRMVPSGQDPDE